MSSEPTKNGAQRVVDLSVAELRQLIKEAVSEEGEIFAMGIRTEADLLLEKFRTLVATSNPNWADLWANSWLEIAADLERNLAEGLRAVNAPAAAPDIAKELARYSDRELNSLLWHEFPKKDLAAIRAAVHKRLGIGASSRRGDDTSQAVGDGEHILIPIKRCTQCVFADFSNRKAKQGECCHPAAGSLSYEPLPPDGIHQNCPMRCGPTVVRIDMEASGDAL